MHSVPGTTRVMRRYRPILAVAVLGLVLAGCVSNAKYNSAIMRLDAEWKTANDKTLRTMGRRTVALAYLHSARLKPGHKISFFGKSLRAEGEAAVLITVSADLLTVACLQGRIESGKSAAKAGEMTVWQPGAAEPQTFDFEVKRLIATMTVPLDTALQSELDALAAKQERMIFWGALQRSTLNTQAIGAPRSEPLRRTYLRKPAIIRLRLKHKTVDDLARGVAEAFVAALAEKDVDTVANLLDPRLFAQDAQARAGGIAAVLRLRRAFAQRLASQNWRSRLAGSQRITATDSNAVWYVAGKPVGLTVILAGFDRFPFVSAIKSATAPPKSTKQERSS